MEEQEEDQGYEEFAGLTIKQRRFIEEYCIDFNATRAAIAAGYSVKTAYSIAFENLKKPEIKQVIQARIDKLTMSADEALIRMSQFARGSFRPFLCVSEGEDVTVVLSSDQAQENLHLIKKIKQTKSYFDGQVTGITTEIELHDAKDAVAKVLQMHGKLVENKKIDLTSGGKRITLFELPDNGRNSK